MNLGGHALAVPRVKHLNYDRPLDSSGVVGELRRARANAPVGGLFDLSAVAYLGHSSGSGAAMMVAGAGREYMPLGLVFAEDRRPGHRGAVTGGGRGRRLPASVLGRRAPTGAHVHRSAGMVTPLTRGATRSSTCPRATSICRGSGMRVPTPRVRRADQGLFAAIHDRILCDDMQAWLGSAIRAFLDADVRDKAVAAANWALRRLASPPVQSWNGTASERGPVHLPTPSATNG